MTDKEYQHAKKRIKAIVDRWVAPCGLRWWQRVTFHWCRDAADMATARGAELSEHSRDVAGATIAKWKYKQADVYFNLDILRTLNDEHAENVVLHEICHILVNEMQEYHNADFNVGLDHEEHVVTNLSMVLDWARCLGRNEMRDQVRKINPKVARQLR